ncbi:MAG: hypothetical protein NZ561_01720 [Phycisphaerae bacterium]|nr:hypothetical protein [Phycisphaerae bacterium]MDW8262576.1 hypothetical protein [Phycisphaerales bacterium]
MAQRDAYLCDVIVIPTDSAADTIDELADRLRAHGLEIRDIHPSQSFIEGTINAGAIHELEKLSGVRYVRCVYCYIADYPDGDPRNQA